MNDLALWIDESEKGEFLLIGGIISKWCDTRKLVRAWQEMKENIGLPIEAEIKWNLPPDHPTRKFLGDLNLKTKDVCERSIQLISRLDLLFVASAMLEKRSIPIWKKIWPKASTRDFWCEGLRYVIQRAAEEVVETKASSLTIICDTPELGKKDFSYQKIKRGVKAIYEEYKRWYLKGVDVGPSRIYHSGGLYEIGFQPSILISDASYHDMLQIADIVIGAIRDWIDNVKNMKSDPWIIEQIKILQNLFRARHGSPEFWGDGLIVWPWSNDLWMALKNSLEK